MRLIKAVIKRWCIQDMCPYKFTILGTHGCRSCPHYQNMLHADGKCYDDFVIHKLFTEVGVEASTRAYVYIKCSHES